MEEEEKESTIQPFIQAKHGKGSKHYKQLPKRVKRFYKKQDKLIEAFEELQMEDMEENKDCPDDGSLDQGGLAKRSELLAKISFAVNLVLMIAKCVVAVLSGSLAIITSVIDSAVDLVSGALMWWSGHAIKKRNIYDYPQGRTKLEPVAIVVLSVIMGLASIQMIRESIEKIIAYASVDATGPIFKVPSIVICVVTIGAKFVLYLVCRRVPTPSCEALAQDHRNDVISNSGALACGLIGYKLWKYADPIGAIAISIYIVVSWCITGYAQIKMLTGYTAPPDLLKKITWLALNHHPEILFIDTVRAFHFGNNFLVEVDIVLPEDMSMKESHDIGQDLQLKIEKLPEVERAFVHLDYEWDHHPTSEHKQV